ncbi:Vgb family protein [Alteromonas halophila]|uniref:Lyase n=1 Tax=Alteromonas halophila TaxID=516698 RepID=A0A918JQR3_9ALTE|nr:lyase [Alteromonas halophila]GGW93474.1 hypothetical protein GCM10007391_29810 [Alteromonas halophila]
MLKHLLALLAALLVSAGVIADDHRLPSNVTFEKWQVPWENTRPRDPMMDSKGNVWFCGQAGNYIGKLNPATGDFARFDMSPNTNPHNLIVDSDDNVWYAGNQNAHIGMLNPETGDITRYPMPDDEARDPHTLTFDAQENIWFTVQWGNFIGYLDTQSGDVTLHKVPISNARPYGIRLDDNDTPWIVLLGTNKLATVQNGEINLIDLPREDARPRRLEITDDGKLWYSDYAEGRLGSYDPQTDTFEEWVLPTGASSSPYATARDNQGRIWLTDTSAIPNQFIGFSPEQKAFISQTEVEFGGHIRHTYVNRTTGAIWFGTDSGYIARAMPE